MLGMSEEQLRKLLEQDKPKIKYNPGAIPEPPIFTASDAIKLILANNAYLESQLKEKGII